MKNVSTVNAPSSIIQSSVETINLSNSFIWFNTVKFFLRIGFVKTIYNVTNSFFGSLYIK